MVKKQISISITGAAGFIGSHLLKRLILENFKIGLILDSFNPSYGGMWCTHRQNFLVPEVEILNINLLEESASSLAHKLDSTDVVVHFAAFPGVRQGELESNKFLINNVNSAGIVLDAIALNKNIKAIIFASSSSVYGDIGLMNPSKEIEANGSQIKSNYAMTKWINEIQFSFRQKKLNIPVFALRFFTVFGRWGRPDMAYSTFTHGILKDAPISIFGVDGGQRAMTHIEDAVELVVRLICLLKDSEFDSKIGFQSFNIASGNSISALEMAQTISRVAGRDPKFVFSERPYGDSLATSADLTKINKFVKPLKKRDLTQDIENYVEWHIENKSLFS
jgi:UDP-glucuronate 4-epimerase